MDERHQHNEETDYSSEYESFFNLGETKEKKSKVKTSTNVETYTQSSSKLLQNASRLELESITLKDTISEVMKTFKDLPVSEIPGVISNINHIKSDVAELKASYKLDQKSMKNANQELITIKKELKTLSEKVSKKNHSDIPNDTGPSDYMNQFQKYASRTDLKLNNLLQTNKELSEIVKIQPVSSPDSFQQLGQIRNQISMQSEDQTKELQEIKQFLKLVLPRIINLENSLQQLANNTLENTSYTEVVTPSPSPSNSRKTSINRKATITKKRRLI
ncbi:hypothetical protein JA1_003652 [Spathaspora sp. JA1]|nr:hypothetical protein JA1_003652 [Spathaspora sp. JA1]